MQLLKNLEPYIQQGLQKVQELKAEQQQSKEGLDAMIFNYRWGCLTSPHLFTPAPICSSEGYWILREKCVELSQPASSCPNLLS